MGQTLKSGLFSKNKIYQEYPVVKINPSYHNNSHKFDWVILDLKIVIECHGEQHSKSVTFGGISVEKALDNLEKQKYRDKIKANAAIEAGYTYLEIPYTDKKNINDDYIWQLYQKHRNINRSKVLKKRKTIQYTEEIKQKTRRYQQELYRKKKEWIKNNKQE